MRNDLFKTTRKYCRVCGEKLVYQKENGFNELTGEHNFLMVCPTGKCDHTGIYHEYGRKPGFFNFIFGSSRCKKCGQDAWDF